ncbi:H(+)/Cl(-) exchange transporter 7 [Halotydeus destructor]|nr:H(+)/Cl(-) exchange transporter 7 [Halotydeus destructor]
MKKSKKGSVDKEDLIEKESPEEGRHFDAGSASTSSAGLGDPSGPIVPPNKQRRINFKLTPDERISRDLCESHFSNSCFESGSIQAHKLGSRHLLSQKFESLDYDVCENTLFKEEQKKHGYKLVFQKNFLRWFVVFFIAILTALTACTIVAAVDIISEFKYVRLKSWMDDCFNQNCLYMPFGFWLITNALPVMIGSIVVTYIAPVAAGSGIPLIKCYLNGVKVPEVIRIKTFLVKAFGVICSVVGGLAVGKEGPMIHCGAVIAAGISQGKSTTFRKDFGVFESFREDKEKRDFVSAGAAAGVAAAFGAPVGGVLFSLEEGASFWNQSLTWMIFFCSMVSTFTLNLVMSYYHGRPGQLSYSGLLNFGKFEDISYSIFELPIYMFMGAVGGMLGALSNHLNHKLTVFRMRYITLKWAKVVEAGLVAVATASIGFTLICLSHDCRKNSLDPDQTSIQFHCPDGEHSVMAELWFNTPEATVRSLFHNAPDTWTPLSLGVFFVCYFLVACWTYGLSISGGLFIPSLLVGAAGGRLFALGAIHLWPDQDWIVPGKFALVGAASMLGGIVRMTISLTVILIEATGNITFGLPIMIALLMAKWVGDYFTEGLYDIHIELNGVPLLPWEPPPLSSNIYASEVMSAPVIAFKTTEKVGTIVDTLVRESHNGFPVVDVDEQMSESYMCGENERSCGRFRGLILRWQLIVLLQQKIFNELSETHWENLSLKTFRSAYPRYSPIESVSISDRERNYTIDLRPFMNSSPYTVPHSASLPRIFRLFRALGLRHLVVVNDRNEAVGMVTRKDLARYRMHYHGGKVSLREMQISYS